MLQSELPNYIRSSLIEGVLENFKDSSLKKAEIAVIEKSLENSITKQYVIDNILIFSNSIFDWIEGKSESISFETSKLNLTEKIASIIPKKYKSNDMQDLIQYMKPCTKEQEIKLQDSIEKGKVDQLCLPSSLRIYSDTDNIDLATQLNIPKFTNQDAMLIKGIFIAVKNLEVIVISLIIILSMIFVFLPPNQKAKAYILSIYSILMGSLLFIVLKYIPIFEYFKNISYQRNPLLQTEPASIAIMDVISSIISSIRVSGSNYSLYLVGFGLLILLAIYLFKFIQSPKNLSTTPGKRSL